jgi:phosphopentomutase
MARFITIILDGFGVGVMPDYMDFNPADKGAHTLKSILSHEPDLLLPTLAKLGLMNIVGFESAKMKFSSNALFGKSKLKHFGADTFFGHQELMGSKPIQPKTEPFHTQIDRVETALRKEKYIVRRMKASHLIACTQSEREILIVNEAAIIADNLESYAGQIYNVTSSLDLLPFDTITHIGKIVRSVVTVPRVIAFAGENVALHDMLAAAELKDADFIGINAPKSGVYAHNYHVIHLGFGVDFTKQAPYLLAQHNIPTYLLGKVADIVETQLGESFPAVDTASVLQKALDYMDECKTGFICCNVQETDLAGHAENTALYADKLRIADAYIDQIIQKMNPEDLLIVAADHGNDPLIGHKGHTREYVPLLIYSRQLQTSHHGACNIGTRESLADISCTAIQFFGLSNVSLFGNSFLDLLDSHC